MKAIHQSDYLTLAADLARTQWPAPATSVVVTCPVFPQSLPVGECEHAFPRCTADEFERGVLTITAVDSGEPIRVFQPTAWLRAVVRDAEGYAEFSFRNEHVQEEIAHRESYRIVARRDRRA